MTEKLVFSIIKNGIINGYPFVESFGSWLNYADRIVIYDGESTDGTDIVLKEMAKLNPKIEVRSAPWPASKLAGRSIAEFTDSAFKEVRPTCNKLIYVQADEIFEKETRQKLSNYEGSKVVQMTRYVLFWNSFYRVLGEEFPGQFAQGLGAEIKKPDHSKRYVQWKSYRFPESVEAHSQGDGLSFDIGSAEFEEWPHEVMHYGWNFPVNILQKHVSHAKIYSDNAIYVRRAAASTEMLSRQVFEQNSLDALDPQYIKCAQPFSGKHPSCVQHLLQMRVYDPYVGLELLKQGVNW